MSDLRRNVRSETAILGPELGRKAYLWFAAIVVAALLRGATILAYRLRYQALPVLTWAGIFTLGSMVSGIVWGLGCAILFVSGNFVAQFVIAFAAAGMGAGAAVGRETRGEVDEPIISGQVVGHRHDHIGVLEPHRDGLGSPGAHHRERHARRGER